MSETKPHLLDTILDSDWKLKQTFDRLWEKYKEKFDSLPCPLMPATESRTIKKHEWYLARHLARKLWREKREEIMLQGFKTQFLHTFLGNIVKQDS